MYTKFYGFTDKPFNVTPDPRFLYLSSNHQEALASMIYGIRERKGFVTIIGEVGTGKTTLLHTLFNQLEKEIKTIFIFNTKISLNQLLQNILIELELHPKSYNKSELLYQLNDFLIEKLSFGENVALFIDEAQNLPIQVLEELRMLSNLETDREKLIQIILVGQPELNNKLNSPRLRQLKQRIGINCYLTPLSHEESKNYILHRLTVAGCEDDHIFSQKAIKLICKHSRGIPRIINILCDNALLSAYGKERRRVDTDIVEEVISDYERSKFSIDERDRTTYTVIKERKKIFNKLRLVTISFIFVIIMLFILGTSLYTSKFNSLLPDLTITWSKIERSINNLLEKDNAKEAKEISANPAKKNNFKDTSINFQKNITDYNQPIIKNQSPPKRALPSLEGSFTPIDSPNIEKNKKLVFARRGDMVSSIALKEYGIFNATICDIIKRANPEIKDLDQIDIGQKIIIPKLDIDSIIVEITKGVFSIHLASFISYDNARQYFNQLPVEKYQISISPVEIAGKRPWYRIMMGNFSSRAQAKKFAKTIKFNNLPLSKF